MTYGRITEEGIADLRSRIGVLLTRSTPPFYTEINADAARHFAMAIGDDNPLWLDEEYARKTRWGGLLAPPCILYSADNAVSGAVEGLPGVHAMFAGTDWEWFQPIRVGTVVRTKTWLKDVLVRETRFAGRAVQQIYTTEFYDQRGALLARADSWCFRTERHTARDHGTKYRERRGIYNYSRDEIERLAAHYRQEARRGAVPRFWEDVEVGEEIPSRLKGPYTITTAVAFMQAWGAYAVRAHRLAFLYYDAHPGLPTYNTFGVPDLPVRVHWDNEFAREVGVPGAYDFGPERISWLSHLLTDWMGDDGLLRRLNVQIRGHNIVGDTTWCKGRVVDKLVVEGEHLVQCEVWAENQYGERTAVGSALVRLPSRGEGG